jgi:hypothetical protein
MKAERKETEPRIERGLNPGAPGFLPGSIRGDKL